MPKKKSIWMPLYIGDYLGDTQLLTTEQSGAYLHLMMAYWKNGGSLPNDDEVLAGATKLPLQKWKKVKPVILKYFTVKDGFLVNKRLDEELKKRDKKSERGKFAANKRWENDENEDQNDDESDAQ